MDINHKYPLTKTVMNRILIMPNKFFDRNWWKDFVVAILATTVSIYRCPAVG